MARPKKEVPPAKEHFVGIRLTEDLYRVIQNEADNAGLSISEYFRRLATKHKIVMQLLRTMSFFRSGFTALDLDPSVFL